MEVDFSDSDSAIKKLRDAMSDRLAESKLINDARTKIGAQTLTQDEIRILQNLAQLETNQSTDLALPQLGMLSIPDERGIDGLIRKGCVEAKAVNAETGTVFYALNAFGYALAKVAENVLPKYKPPAKKEEPDEE